MVGDFLVVVGRVTKKGMCPANPRHIPLKLLVLRRGLSPMATAAATAPATRAVGCAPTATVSCRTSSKIATAARSTIELVCGVSSTTTRVGCPLHGTTHPLSESAALNIAAKAAMGTVAFLTWVTLHPVIALHPVVARLYVAAPIEGIAVPFAECIRYCGGGSVGRCQT